MKHTSIYIVDDSITIRAMMQSLIERDTAFEVCGVAGDGEQALDEISEIRPEIILLDLAMPTLDGLAFLDRVQARGHDPRHGPKVVVVSSSATFHAPVCADAFERGAVACFDKSSVCAKADELLTLLHEVSEGTISRYHHGSTAVTLPKDAHNDNAAYLVRQPAAASGRGPVTFV